LAALLGFAFVLFLRTANWEYSWRPSDYALSAVIIFAPMALVLVLGWVVAGFRQEKSN
jgi:hypothetical protein